MKEHIFKQYLENILNYLDLSLEELFEKTKKDKVVKPRNMLYYICNVKSNMGQKEISGYLKKLDIKVSEENIYYGIKSIEKLIEKDIDYVPIINKLSKIDSLSGQEKKNDFNKFQRFSKEGQLKIFSSKQNKVIENSLYNFCSSCLKQIIVPGNFCTNCGNKLI